MNSTVDPDFFVAVTRMVTRSSSEIDDNLIKIDFEKTENLGSVELLSGYHLVIQQKSLVIDNNNL